MGEERFIYVVYMDDDKFKYIKYPIIYQDARFIYYKETEDNGLEYVETDDIYHGINDLTEKEIYYEMIIEDETLYSFEPLTDEAEKRFNHVIRESMVVSIRLQSFTGKIIHTACELDNLYREFNRLLEILNTLSNKIDIIESTNIEDKVSSIRTALNMINFTYSDINHIWEEITEGKREKLNDGV